MADNGALNPRQRRFLAALIAGPNVREAAKAAGIAERTAWRYVRDPGIKAELAEHQDALLADVGLGMAEAMGEALTVVLGVVKDKAQRTQDRLTACRIVLDSGLRLAELVTLAQRVAELEAEMAREELEGVRA
jgi:phage terminase small subunit